MSSPRSVNVEHILDLFDEAWNGPTPPIIEDYLAGVGPDSPSYMPMLSELVKIDLERRFKRGEQPVLEEYRRRFPACAGDLAGWLDEARAVAQRAAMSQETNDPGTPPTLDVPPFPATLTPPVRILGEYELLERLGGGGMGEVYKARHRRLNKLVALKLLPAGSQSSRETAARFQREMQAVGALDHPNVVEAHDAGEQASEVYLAMKLIDGVDLDRLVKQRGLLPIAEACELVRQAALGLHYLHEKGLVHRDIKPSNLMRTPDGTVKVLDLGLARWCIEREAGHGLTGMGRWMGTPDYLAPEQIVNATDADARADLYGLGGTLFYLLTGKAPFAHHTSQYSKLEAHRHEAPPDLRTLRPDAPPELAALVQRLLAKEPQQRFATAAEVAAALTAFVPGAQREQTPAAAVQEARAPHVPADGTTNRRRALKWMIRLPKSKLSCSLTLVFGLMVVVLVGYLAYRWFTPEEGDIIIADKPLEKFVLALSNQKIQPDDAVVKPYQLSSNDLDKLARLLVKKRSKAHLTEQEQWLCAVAASLLDLNGRPVEDLDRWTGDAYLEKVSARIAGDAKLIESPHELKREAMVLLLVADMAYVRRDWGAAIKGYERYLRIAERNSSLKDVMGESTLATAIKRAGNTYLERADALADEGKVKEATDDRSAAYRLYGRFNNIAIAGTDLDIRPDENKKPKDWLEKLKETGKAQSEARKDGTLWLHNENSSFAYYRLIKVDKPNEICFRWRWRLDDSPPGFRDPDGISSLHPLAVIVVFLDGQKLIALHYIWDPLEPIGKSWIARQSKDKFKFGQDEYETEYPNIVVASKSDPLGVWQTYTRDLAEDYRMIYKRDPPPIRAVAIQTEAQNGPADQKRVAEGSVAGLQFDTKVNGRCPDPRPR